MKAIIFVVDANDHTRTDLAKDELNKMLQEHDLQNLPLLVFAHKQDLPNAYSCDQIIQKLGLNTIQDRKWHIEGSMGNTGNGLYQGFDWLNQVLFQ